MSSLKQSQKVRTQGEGLNKSRDYFQTSMTVSKLLLDLDKENNVIIRCHYVCLTTWLLYMRIATALGPPNWSIKYNQKTLSVYFPCLEAQTNKSYMLKLFDPTN